jgi:hypothetical protein
MTTVRPEAAGTVAAGQVPVKLGMRSLEVNAPGGSVVGVAAGVVVGVPAGVAEGPGAEALGEAGPGPVHDATRSSGTVMPTAHRRRRRPVRGVDIVLPL